MTTNTDQKSATKPRKSPRIPENCHPGNARFLHSPHLKIETSRSINSLGMLYKTKQVIKDNVIILNNFIIIITEKLPAIKDGSYTLKSK